MWADPGGGRRVVLAHPSPDVYGSDLQLAESVRGLVEHGWLPTVVLPADGPLRPLLEERGAEVQVSDFPVLRRALLRPRPLAGLVLRAPATVWRLRRLLRASGARAVYVNTLTIPLWVVAARAAGLPVLCHSHEAERLARPARLALTAPLLLSDVVLANSASTREVLTSTLRRLARRVVVVHNGVPDPGPPAPPRVRGAGEELRLVVVSRLSPRKGIHVAVQAVALLHDQGLDVTLDVCGSTFPGYEWYERALRDQVGDLGLTDAVTFHGYVAPTRPLLEAADVVLVPSFGESFGNVAVEGMLAGRPVVASDVQGLAEVLEHGVSGVLVEPGSAPALAEAVAALDADPALAERLADAGRQRATSRFGVDRYRALVAFLVAQVAGDPVPVSAAPARPGSATAGSTPSRR
ncbi:glycosyltransferase family 4 protein [Georgenia wutianyii]|uniref:Glycosyltransferase family 4 protein n=1 Tax=Georgenia wutianyii TaxID=2585135 RepID=A0ABX5VSL0_9MICO|nr:glycosyltransferase family 4 protein [Georgenia wutianyii]QDB80174.1 glycosyltransferase family 4 protein [Georgenia wutianyii]